MCTARGTESRGVSVLFVCDGRDGVYDRGGYLTI
jgi:hypothetical protein